MLSKTRKKVDVATVSAPKRRPYLGILLIIFGVLAVWQGIRGLADTNHRVLAPKAVISVETATSQETRERGLSGRSALADETGMLFVFEEASVQHCIWMKDMLFSIDIVWLDAQKRVIKVLPNVSPDTYPQSYCPESSTLYVLEVGAGQSNKYGIDVGATLKF